MSEINKEELLEKIRRKKSLHLVDVRNAPDYRKEHIPGAIHLLISATRTSSPTRGVGGSGKKRVILSRKDDCRRIRFGLT